MNSRIRKVCLFLFLALPLIAQEPPSGGHREMPAPKNLKLLKPDNLMPTMMAFKTALGEECSFCHVKGDFASDENHNKEAARHMITMAREINAKFPDGQMHVTCYTCHRGAKEPATAPAQ